MLFPLPDGGIVVEYDGALFHRGREQHDQDKSSAVMRRSSLVRALVVRIREQPLRRLSSRNVSVPARSSGQRCAQLAMLHIAHRLPRVWRVDELPAQPETRIVGFLQAGVPLDRDTIACRRCRYLESAVMDGCMCGDNLQGILSKVARLRLRPDSGASDTRCGTGPAV
jgi:hypothetical protein